MKNDKTSIKIAAIADIHVRHTSKGKYTEMFQEIERQADVLVLCGDLTDHGLVEEAEILAQELKACNIPKVAVLGNHDYENGFQNQVKTILSDNDVIMLEEEVFEIKGIGFAGVKGFAGGFGKYMLTAFGEPEIKAFVDIAMEEVEQLEISLGKIAHFEKKIVAMHYSPITQTLQGEPLEIYPFLGNSRLEEVIDRFNVNVVLHGHAHYGSHEGKTASQVPVYNVAMPLLGKTDNKKPYKIIEI